MPFWTAAEAAELLLGYQPGFADAHGRTDLQLERKAIQILIEREIETGQLSGKGDRIRPEDMCLWSLGHPFQLHPLFWELFSRPKRTKAAEDAPSKTDLPIPTRTKRTLLTLIVGMAMRKYRYRPGDRNSAAINIANDLAEVGLQVSDDTVRRYLEEAVQELDLSSARRGPSG